MDRMKRDPFAVEPLPKSFYHPTSTKNLTDAQKKTNITAGARGETSLNADDQQFLNNLPSYLDTSALSNAYDETWNSTNITDESLRLGAIRGEIESRRSRATMIPVPVGIPRRQDNRPSVKETRSTQGKTYPASPKPNTAPTRTETKGSVLSRYIERFRHGSPTRREDRKSRQTDGDFWWLRNSTQDTFRSSLESHDESRDQTQQPVYPALTEDALAQHLKELGQDDVGEDKEVADLNRRAEELIRMSHSSVNVTTLRQSGSSSTQQTTSTLDENPYRPKFAPDLDKMSDSESVQFSRADLTRHRMLLDTKQPQSPEDILSRWRARHRLESLSTAPAGELTSEERLKAGLKSLGAVTVGDLPSTASTSQQLSIEQRVDSRIAEIRKRLRIPQSLTGGTPTVQSEPQIPPPNTSGTPATSLPSTVMPPSLTGDTPITAVPSAIMSDFKVPSVLAGSTPTQVPPGPVTGLPQLAPTTAPATCTSDLTKPADVTSSAHDDISQMRSDLEFLKKALAEATGHGGYILKASEHPVRDTDPDTGSVSEGSATRASSQRTVGATEADTNRPAAQSRHKSTKSESSDRRQTRRTSRDGETTSRRRSRDRETTSRRRSKEKTKARKPENSSRQKLGNREEQPETKSRQREDMEERSREMLIRLLQESSDGKSQRRQEKIPLQLLKQTQKPSSAVVASPSLAPTAGAVAPHYHLESDIISQTASPSRVRYMKKRREEKTSAKPTEKENIRDEEGTTTSACDQRTRSRDQKTKRSLPRPPGLVPPASSSPVKSISRTPQVTSSSPVKSISRTPQTPVSASVDSTLTVITPLHSVDVQRITEKSELSYSSDEEAADRTTHGPSGPTDTGPTDSGPTDGPSASGESSVEHGSVEQASDVAPSTAETDPAGQPPVCDETDFSPAQHQLEPAQGLSTKPADTTERPRTGPADVTSDDVTAVTVDDINGDKTGASKQPAAEPGVTEEPDRTGELPADNSAVPMDELLLLAEAGHVSDGEHADDSLLQVLRERRHRLLHVLSVINNRIEQLE